MSGHIVLIGLSGSGKSTVGRLLAAALERPLYDTDQVLAERTGMPVPRLLRADPPRFRALEEEVVRAVCAAPGGVIATGGGAVLSAHNHTVLRQGNLVVWLQAPPPVLAKRLRGGEERPLLHGDDPVVRLAALAAERAALYARCAHVSVDVGDLSPSETMRRIQAAAVEWESTR